MTFRQALVQLNAMQDALRSQPQQSPTESALLKITAATPIGVQPYRWLYTVRFARVGGPPGYNGAVEGTTDMYAISHSELNNTATNYSWGVTAANLVAGFTPRQIPLNSYCVGVPHTCTDGTFVWLLLNDQQIDGTCPP